ncbi:MAG TPA: nitrogen fixation protein FixH [Ideonella sp.]|nr:nitrogen fixation protein FixH [Ideonella sp.]
MPTSCPEPSLPWWRFPMVWLVIAGPAIVVLAGFATLGLAMHDGDKPLNAALPHSGSLAPATQARNHAAAAHP